MTADVAPKACARRRARRSRDEVHAGAPAGYGVNAGTWRWPSRGRSRGWQQPSRSLAPARSGLMQVMPDDRPLDRRLAAPGRPAAACVGRTTTSRPGVLTLPDRCDRGPRTCSDALAGVLPGSRRRARHGMLHGRPSATSANGRAPASEPFDRSRRPAATRRSAMAVARMPSRGTRCLAALALLAMTACWGSTFYLIHDLVDRVPAVDFLAVRFALASAAMLLVAPARSPGSHPRCASTRWCSALSTASPRSCRRPAWRTPRRASRASSPACTSCSRRCSPRRSCAPGSAR